VQVRVRVRERVQERGMKRDNVRTRDCAGKRRHAKEKEGMRKQARRHEKNRVLGCKKGCEVTRKGTMGL